MGTAIITIESARAEEVKVVLVTRSMIYKYVEDLYNVLKPGDQLIIQIEREQTYIQIRRKGHNHSRVKERLDNYGFGIKKSVSELGEAIREISDDIPEYCFRAINGDIDCMRQTVAWRKKAIQERLHIVSESAQKKIEIAKRAGEAYSEEEMPYKNLKASLYDELEDIEKINQAKTDEEFLESLNCITISIEK